MSTKQNTMYNEFTSIIIIIILLIIIRRINNNNNNNNNNNGNNNNNNSIIIACMIQRNTCELSEHTAHITHTHTHSSP